MDQESSSFSDRQRQVNEIITAYLEAADAGEAPDRQEWLRQYPEFAAELEAFLAEYSWMNPNAEPLPPAADGTPAPPESVVSGEPVAMDVSPPNLAQPASQPDPVGRPSIALGITLVVLASVVIAVVTTDYLARSERRAIDEKKHAASRANNTLPWSTPAQTIPAARDDKRQAKGSASATDKRLDDKHGIASVPVSSQADSGPLHSIPWWDAEQGFNANIYQTGISADGKLFFGAGDAGPTGAIRIFDVASGKAVQEFRPGTSAWFSFAAFVPGGKYLAAGYNLDKDLYLWEIATGKVVRKFVGHTDSDNRLAVSPDGKRILSWGKDRTLRLWDVETGEELKKLEGHTERAEGVFSPDGKTILTFSPDKTLRLWDADSGKELRKLEGHTAEVTGCFSPDGKQVLSSGLDRTLRLWDVEAGKEIRRFEGPKDNVTWAHFLAAGSQVAVLSDDGTFRVCETTGTLLQEINLSDLGADRRSMTASPDGRLGLVSCSDGSVRVYDLASGKEIHRYTGAANAQSYSFTPDGKFAVAGSFRRGLYVFRLPK